jgi:hypothetical protein
MGEGMDYSIGHLRLKYLDSANVTFAQSNFIQSEGYIKAFIDTIPEKTKAYMDLRIELDQINTRRKKQLEQLQTHLKTLGYLESKDTENRGREEIEINAIHDKKVACWRISLSEGLFND